MEKNIITAEGLAQLQDELDFLMGTAREENKAALKAARELGDLSENADYDVAREKQAEIEGRIAELNAFLANVEVVEKTANKKVVNIGSIFTFKDLETNEEETFEITGSYETNPFNGKISNLTPLAKAVIGHKVNDVVTVEANVSYDIKIIKIQ
ncbi:MAG: transcription elongation factor GreA [Erysipelotrichaceae bacterium]